MVSLPPPLAARPRLREQRPAPLVSLQLALLPPLHRPAWLLQQVLRPAPVRGLSTACRFPPTSHPRLSSRHWRLQVVFAPRRLWRSILRRSSSPFPSPS